MSTVFCHFFLQAFFWRAELTIQNTSFFQLASSKASYHSSADSRLMPIYLHCMTFEIINLCLSRFSGAAGRPARLPIPRLILCISEVGPRPIAAPRRNWRLAHHSPAQIIARQCKHGGNCAVINDHCAAIKQYYSFLVVSFPMRAAHADVCGTAQQLTEIHNDIFS